MLFGQLMREFLTGRTTTEMRVTSRQEALQGFPQVHQEMPAVDNLTGVWGTLAGAPRIFRRTVAHNDRNTRVVVQPGGEGVGRAIRQEVNRATSCEINEDAAGYPALAEGKIVHTKNRWGADARERGGA